jgi:hypothetical protein
MEGWGGVQTLHPGGQMDGLGRVLTTQEVIWTAEGGVFWCDLLHLPPVNNLRNSLLAAASSATLSPCPSESRQWAASVHNSVRAQACPHHDALY